MPRGRRWDTVAAPQLWPQTKSGREPLERCSGKAWRVGRSGSQNTRAFWRPVITCEGRKGGDKVRPSVLQAGGFLFLGLGWSFLEVRRGPRGPAGNGASGKRETTEAARFLPLSSSIPLKSSLKPAMAEGRNACRRSEFADAAESHQSDLRSGHSKSEILAAWPSSTEEVCHEISRYWNCSNCAHPGLGGVALFGPVDAFTSTSYGLAAEHEIRPSASGCSTSG